MSFFNLILFDKNNNMNILVIHDNSIVGKNIHEIIENKKDKNNWLYINFIELTILELEAYFINFTPNIVIYIFGTDLNNSNIFDLILITTCVKFNLEYLIIFCNTPTSLVKNFKKFNLSIKYLCLFGKYIYGNYGKFIKTENEINRLIYNIFITKRENKILKINSDYKIKDKYIYVNDIINILYFITTEKLSIIENKIIDICQYEFNYNIKELVNLILKAFSINLKIEYFSKINTPVFLTEKDNRNNKKNKASIIQDFNYIPIDQSIINTVKWFLDNYPNIE